MISRKCEKFEGVVSGSGVWGYVVVVVKSGCGDVLESRYRESLILKICKGVLGVK